MATTTTPEDEVRGARLKAAREREQKREQERLREAEDRELEFSELEAELEKTHGRSGRDFAIVTTTHGLVAARRGESLQFTSWRAKVESSTPEAPMHHADVANFATAHVIHPSREEFEALIDRAPGIADKIAGVLTSLYMGTEVARIPK